MKGNFKNILFGLLGVTLSLMLFLFVNSSYLSSKKKTNSDKVVNFEVQKINKKKEFKKVVQKKEIKKEKALKPNVRSMIKGMAFGLPAFEVDLDSTSGLLGEDGYMNGSEVQEKPKVLYRPELIYPEKALEEDVKGFVVLGVFINKFGELEKADVMESVPKGVFDKAALENVKRWKFKPAKHKGVSVSTWQEQRISFGSREES